MATRGTISQTFGGYYRLQLEWESTQNVSAGTSSITAKLYLISLSSYTTISSSSSKTFSITIGGVTNSTTGNLNLRANEKKLLHTYSRTLSHESDGTLEVLFKGYMQWGLNINGHTSDVTVSRTESLPTISTASTIGSVSEWRAGNTMSVAINRKTSSYTHTVRAYVRGTLVATRTGVGTSVTFDFTDAELTKIFNAVGTSTSAAGEVQVDTYSGGSKIGSTAKKDVVIMAAMRSTFDPNMDKTIEVGDSFVVRPVRYNYRLRHEIEMIRNGVVKGIVKMPAGEAQTTFSTGAIVDYLYDEIGTKQYIAVTLRLTTYYGTQQVRTPADITMSIYPKEEDIAPTFSGSFTATEADTAVGTKLGAGYFLRGESDVKVTVPTASLAQAKAGAHIASYTITIGDTTETVYRTAGDTTAVTATLNNVNATGSTTITVTATDSRGGTATQSMTVNFIAYAKPRIIASAERSGRFENSTLVEFAGAISAVMKGTTAINSVQRKRYRYKAASTTTWGSWQTLANSTSNATFTLNLDNTKAYDIEFELVDKFKTETTRIAVPAGRPTLFLDSDLNSVGVNKFPTRRESFETPLAYIDELNVGSTKLGSGGDIDATSSRLSLGGNKTDIDMFSGAFRVRPYSNDVTLSTTKGLFYFADKIEAPEVKSSTFSSTLNMELNAYTHKWTLRSDGRTDFPSYRMMNNANMMTFGGVSHTEPVIMQKKNGSVAMAGRVLVTDIIVYYDRPFVGTPDIVFAQSTNYGGNYHAVAYEIFSNYCKVAVRRVDGGTHSVTATFQVIAIGRV